MFSRCFKPSRQNKDFFIFTRSFSALLAKNSPLKNIDVFFSDYEIDQFRKPDTGPGSIPHTKEEAKKSGMNENEWRNAGQTQPTDDKPYWARAEDTPPTPIEESQSQKQCAWETPSDGNYLQGETLNV